MATQSTVGAKMGNTQMVIRLVVAAAALLAASQARAEQVKICEQTVDYKPTGTPSPAINGVWEGTIDWGIRYKSCHGLVVEGLDDKGRIVGQQAWNNSNGPNSDIRGMAYIGKGPLIITKQSDGTYTIGKFFTLRLEGNKLVGKFHYQNDSGDHDVVLIKR
jgi:hypothetical protein